MKKFPYKFTLLVKLLFVLGLLVAVGVIVVNVLHFAKAAEPDTYTYITLISTVLVAVAAIVIGISILVSSNFIVDDEYLTLRWGFLKNKIKILDITKLVKLEASNKLLVHFTNESYMVVFIDSKYFDDFSSFLVSKNKNIVIEYTSG